MLYIIKSTQSPNAQLEWRTRRKIIILRTEEVLFGLINLLVQIVGIIVEQQVLCRWVDLAKLDSGLGNGRNKRNWEPGPGELRGGWDLYRAYATHWKGTNIVPSCDTYRRTQEYSLTDQRSLPPWIHTGWAQPSPFDGRRLRLFCFVLLLDLCCIDCRESWDNSQSISCTSIWIYLICHCSSMVSQIETLNAGSSMLLSHCNQSLELLPLSWRS